MEIDPMELYEETVMAAQIIKDEKEASVQFATATNGIVDMTTTNSFGTVVDTTISIPKYDGSPSTVLTPLFERYNNFDAYSFEIALCDEESFNFSTNKAGGYHFMYTFKDLKDYSPAMQEFAKDVLDVLKVPYTMKDGVPHIGKNLYMKKLTPKDVSKAADFILENYNHAKIDIGTSGSGNPIDISVKHNYNNELENSFTALNVTVFHKGKMKKIESKRVNDIIADLIDLGIDFGGEWDMCSG